MVLLLLDWMTTVATEDDAATIGLDDYCTWLNLLVKPLKMVLLLWDWMTTVATADGADTIGLDDYCGLKKLPRCASRTIKRSIREVTAAKQNKSSTLSIRSLLPHQ
ncbi:hypothetical protein SLA2020_047680 [Shorea laevis]